MSKQRQAVYNFVKANPGLTTRQIDDAMTLDGIGYADKKEKRRLHRLNWALDELQDEGLIEKYTSGDKKWRWRA